MAFVLALGGVARDAVEAAPPAASSADTWAAEWSIVGPTGTAQATLTGLQPVVGAAGLALAGGSDQGELETPVHDMGHTFGALGALWQADVPAAGSLALAVRTSFDGVNWAPWQDLQEDVGGPDKAAGNLRYSILIMSKGRYVQVRATLTGAANALPVLHSLKLAAIDASAGPQAPQATALETVSGPTIITRAQWGANESYRFSGGQEIWPPEYAPVTHVVVHHTDTPDTTDPAYWMRAIYYYHAVTLGWGDIGYNYVVDQQGRIYEGRFGGDGVIGGHALQYNRGSIGVAILGTYQTEPVPAAAVSALEDLLAAKCTLNGINPLQSSWLYDRTLPNIMGHRDCNVTTCPGDQAYALLPQIRNAVWARMQAPQVLISQPTANAILAGVVPVRWQVTPQPAQVSVSVDGQVRAMPSPSAGLWSWDTTVEQDGQHTLSITATSAQGKSSTATVTVSLDNSPPTGSLSATAYTSGSSVTLNLNCTGCTQMQFSQGWSWESESQPHQSNTGVLVTDPLAGNGQAWEGIAGQSSAGAWYGPYFCGLPWPGNYEAVFWLRGQASDPAATLADLDVSDEAGLRILAGPKPVLGADLVAGRYQGVRVPFQYPDHGTSCTNPSINDGLEVRTWYKATGNLWLDRVEIYTAPQAFATQYSLALPNEGCYPVRVRFLDAAGNASPEYSQTIIVDRTPPVWGTADKTGVHLQDALSGVDSSGAAYALSDDGTNWGPWVPVMLYSTGSAGTVPVQETWSGHIVKVRARDRAGNVSESKPITWTPDMNPWLPAELVKSRSYCPLMMQNP